MADSWLHLDRRRANVVVGAATVVVGAVLALLAVELHATQATARNHVVSRFHARAQVVSALTQAIITSAASGARQSVEGFGPSGVSEGQLAKLAAKSNLEYALVLDRNGKVVAESRSLPAWAKQEALDSPAVKAVLTGAPVSLSDVMPSVGAKTVDKGSAPGRPGGSAGSSGGSAGSSGGSAGSSGGSAGSSGGSAGSSGGLVEFVESVQYAGKPSALVMAMPVALLATALDSYLSRIPTPDGAAYVVDGKAIVLGAHEKAVVAGRSVPAGLAAALAKGPSGPYGEDGYFTTARMPSSGWRVVETSGRSALFSSISGAKEWLPWAIYAALGLVALGFLMLVRLLLGKTAELSSTNEQLAGANGRLESSNALLRHAAELARSNAELEQFASIASHDLQEPLRKVQTFAAQLTATERERLSDQGQDFLRRMSEAAGRMRSLIDDLLTFSRVSTQARPFGEVDLAEVLDEVLGDLEVRVKERGAQVRVGELPTIEADPVQMRQLMQNLLANALKFCREGVVPEVTVSAVTIGHLVEVTVKDNGIGFDQQYATRIFRAFERLHGARAYSGTGIGLALCRKIVERHNGTITATGELGSGAVFTVKLPLEQPDGTVQQPSLFPETPEDAHVFA